MAKIFTVLKGGEVESGAPLTIVNGGKFLTLGESGRGRTLSLIRWLGPTEITRQAPEACPSCGGEGRHFKGSFRIGEPAPGSGMSTYDPSLWEDRYHPCINCNGTGKNPRAGEDYEPLLVTSTGPQVWATLSEKGKLIEIEPSSPAEAGDKALVIIRDQSGYRGGWVLYGRAIGQPSPNSEGYAEKGTQKETTPIPVATGTCAQGDAGRMLWSLHDSMLNQLSR